MFQITRFVTNITEAKIAVYQSERLYRFAFTSPEVKEAENPLNIMSYSEGRVEFKDVLFGYNHDQNVLEGVTFEVKPGQKVAIVKVVVGKRL